MNERAEGSVKQLMSCRRLGVEKTHKPEKNPAAAVGFQGQREWAGRAGMVTRGTSSRHGGRYVPGDAPLTGEIGTHMGRM